MTPEPSAVSAMQSRPWRIPAVSLSLVVVGFVSYYGLLLGSILLGHWSNAFALEINESICLDLAKRVLDGRALFAEPSVDFISSCYPSFYFRVAGAVLSFTGPGLPALRLVSIGSLVLLCVLTGVGMKKCGYSRMAILVSIGLFLASYQKSGAWYELARVDMLHILLLAGGFWCFVFGRTKFFLLAGITLICLSVQTKQTTLFFLPAIVLLVRSRFGNAWATGALLLSISAFAMELLLNEWAWFYLVKLPRQQDLVLSRIDLFTDWALPFVAITMAVQSLVSLGSTGLRKTLGAEGIDAGFGTGKILPREADGRQVSCEFPLSPLYVWAFYLCALAGGLLGSLKVGGSLNHFIPLFYFGSIIIGIAWDKRPAELSAPVQFWLVRGFVLLQLGLCFYTQSFSRSQTERAHLDQKVLDYLQGLERSTLPVYCHRIRANHIAVIAGFDALFNYQSLVDLQISGEEGRAEAILRQLRERIARKKLAYILAIDKDLDDPVLGLGTDYSIHGFINKTSFGNIAVLVPLGASLSKIP
jgi:hypothetical protein